MMSENLSVVSVEPIEAQYGYKSSLRFWPQDLEKSVAFLKESRCIITVSLNWQTTLLTSSEIPKASTLRCPKTNRRQKRNQKIASLLILLVAGTHHHHISLVDPTFSSSVFGCCNVVRIITNFYEVQ